MDNHNPGKIIKIDTKLIYSDEEFKQALQGLINSQNELKKSFSLLSLDINERIKNTVDITNYCAASITASLVESWKDLSETVSLSVDTIIKSIPLDDIISNSKKLPDSIKEVLLLLSEYGWYYDPEIDLSVLWIIKKEIQNMNRNAVDNYLVNYYKKNIHRIKKSLLKNFPNRQLIIAKSFKAHNKKEYELSIPVLLTQIDGICKEKTGFYLFIRDKKNNLPKTANYVLKDDFSDIKRAKMYPLSTIMPVMKNMNERGNDYHELNRHLVLHGDSIDYANEINGYKAISLINYVGGLFK